MESSTSKAYAWLKSTRMFYSPLKRPRTKSSIRALNTRLVPLQVMNYRSQVRHRFARPSSSIHKSTALNIEEHKTANRWNSLKKRQTPTSRRRGRRREKREAYTWRPERITGIAWACTRVGTSKPILSVYNKAMRFRLVKLISTKILNKRRFFFSKFLAGFYVIIDIDFSQVQYNERERERDLGAGRIRRLGGRGWRKSMMRISRYLWVPCSSSLLLYYWLFRFSSSPWLGGGPSFFFFFFEVEEDLLPLQVLNLNLNGVVFFIHFIESGSGSFGLYSTCISLPGNRPERQGIPCSTTSGLDWAGSAPEPDPRAIIRPDPPSTTCKSAAKTSVERASNRLLR